MRKLVLTYMMGGAAFDAMGEVSLPYWRRYAAKVGADFRVETRRRLSGADDRLEKCFAREHLREYDRVLVVDIDMMVRPDCPDLFELVPPGRFAAMDEGHLYNSYVGDGLFTDLCATARAYGLTTALDDDYGRLYLNTGICLFDRSHVGMLTPYRPDAEPGLCGFGDQTIINLRLRQLRPRLFLLPLCFNSMFIYRTTTSRDSDFILHWAGVPNDYRIAEMRDIAAAWRVSYPDGGAVRPPAATRRPVQRQLPVGANGA